MEKQTLVSAHLSSVFASTTHVTTHAVPTSRRDIPIPSPRSDIPDGHASYSSLFRSPVAGHVLVRIVQGSLAIELLSLTFNVSPVRFAFPATLLPNPSLISVEDNQLHLFAVTSVGSLYRIIITVSQEGNLWHESLRRDWCREWPIKRIPAGELRLVHVHDVNTVAVGLRSGGYLRLESNYSVNNPYDDHWTETEFRANSWYSSLLHPLPSSSPPSEIIAISSVPQPTDIPDVFTLSRDRILRRWTPDKGSRSEVTMTLGNSSHTSEKNLPLLEANLRKLIQVITVPPSDPESQGAESHFLIAFSPTPNSSAAGGFFNLYDLGNWHVVFSCNTSAKSACCKLQDFIYSNGKLYVLWEKQGQALLEVTPFQEDVDCEWTAACSGQNDELSQSAIDELLLRPGSMTDKFMSAILRPGVFSSITLKTALQDYKEHYLSLPGIRPSQLFSNYPTLGETIAGIVGCTVELTKDPYSGQVLHTHYWNALRRDWEGFVARCRDIERSARWPLGLGSIDQDGTILLFERERIGQYVEQDGAMWTYRCLSNSWAIEPAQQLLSICYELLSKVSSQLIQRIENEILNVVNQEISFPLSDIIVEASNRVFTSDDMIEGLESWVSAKLRSIDNLDHEMRSALDVIGGMDKIVKQEEDEVELIIPPTSTEWSRAIITSYIAETVETRYRLSLALAVLIFHVDSLNDFDPALLAEVFAVIRGVLMLRFLARQAAGDLSGKRPTSQDSTSADDVVARLNSMHVSRDGKNLDPTYSLIHVLLSQFHHPNALPSAAHYFLDSVGVMSTESLTLATKSEVFLCENLRHHGYREACRQLLEWLPRTGAVCYVRGRLWVDVGREDEAALLLGSIAASFGPNSSLTDEDAFALSSVLPSDGLFPSEFDYYLHIAEIFREAAFLSSEVSFTEKALSVIPEEEEVSELWGTVIRGYTDLALYEDAYSALVASPEEDLKRQYVSHLVYKMCDDGALDRLLTFNFLGLENEVEAALSFKARNADPRAQPNYSQILYTWYISRGDYRNAAQAMYIRSRKLSELQGDPSQSIHLIELQSESLSMALNTLSLLDGKNPWIVVPIIPGSSRPKKKRRLDSHIPSDKFSTGRAVDVLSLSDIQEEYIHVIANIEVLRRDPSLGLDGLSSAWVTVTKLMQSGLCDLALLTAKNLSVDMAELFSRLAFQCLRLSGSFEHPLADVSTSEWLLTDKETSWSGSPADRGWRYLRQALELYDSLESDFKYSKAVLDTLLAHDPTSDPPPWLSQRVEDHHPEHLIRQYLKYGKFKETLTVTLCMVKKAALTSSRTTHASSTWLSYPLIDAVLKGTEDNSSTEVQSLRQSLQNELKQRLSRAQVRNAKSH